MARRRTWLDDQPTVTGKLWGVHLVGAGLALSLLGIFLAAWHTGSTFWHVAWLAWFTVTVGMTLVLSSQPRRLQRDLDRVWAGRLHERSIRDELTGLHNRRYFHDALEGAVAAAEAGHPFTLLFVDLNGFKQINDRHGHGVGDQALIHAARLLRAGTPVEGDASRIGGDEFAIILPGFDARAAEALAVRLDAAFLAAPFVGNGRHVPIELACGAGEWQRGMGPADVLRVADAALYRRKAELIRAPDRKAG